MLTYEHVLAYLADPEHAVKPGPGKFEGCADLRVAKAVRELSLDKSNVDDELGTLDGEAADTWFGLMDRFVMWEDHFGFFSYEVFDTHEEAKLSFLGH